MKWLKIYEKSNISGTEDAWLSIEIYKILNCTSNIAFFEFITFFVMVTFTKQKLFFLKYNCTIKKKLIKITKHSFTKNLLQVNLNKWIYLFADQMLFDYTLKI